MRHCTSALIVATITAACSGQQATDTRSPTWVLDHVWDADDVKVGDLRWGQVTRVAISPSGHIYVADAIASTVFVLERDGVPFRAVGKPGSGPGEFVQLANIGIRGDTLWAWDARQQAITWFDSAGRILRSRRMPSVIAASGRISFVTLLENGSSLDVPVSGPEVITALPLYQTDSTRVPRSTAAHVNQAAGGILRFSINERNISFVNPVGVRGRWSVSADGSALSVANPIHDGDNWSLEIVSRSSDLQGRFELVLPVPTDAVRLVDARDTVTSILVSLSVRPSDARRMAAEAVPETPPGFRHQVIVSVNGTTWIGLERESDTVWRAFDVSGVERGTFIAPLPWRVRAIEDTAVIMSTTDEWELPRLRMSHLRTQQ